MLSKPQKSIFKVQKPTISGKICPEVLRKNYEVEKLMKFLKDKTLIIYRSTMKKKNVQENDNVSKKKRKSSLVVFL